MFLSNCAIIGVFGMQQAGKTTTVRRLVQHAARSITARELTSNTSFPVPYQEGNVHVIDFPGMGGAGNDFDKYTHLYGEICQAVLVVLPPEFSLTDAEVKLLTLVKVRTLFQ
ncbi:hypothetical protein BCR33DRAFT_716680 [Rhizoclosmatium globosum]|uniref:G domain-containing protein n=1 Tax=Rhizoclosmatium globosum TaxID=329046 RepID=A0A1Y2CCD3_9FUNG|nr:hypothetical protein BCR33DRAFT_716678 [Rhizoclosmatium globosum]ORY44711.1 hypothetical protein BCR33DRAFT_716680 [Rhizoclosmatium globosum]|eukprot:ORY44709.1 hypothetical protein BCR33DRAFT_716678 [Rhizoclosmatium globosum]